jgi:hypothetical protein
VDVVAFDAAHPLAATITASRTARQPSHPVDVAIRATPSSGS